jgi:PAS domain S-box-containing protein
MTMPSPLRTLAGNWLAGAFLLLAAGIGALWYSAISAYEAAVLRERGRELQATAELKIEFIRFWLEVKRGNATVPGRSELIAHAAEFGLDLDAPSVRKTLMERLTTIQTNYHYQSILLLDRTGQVRVEAGHRDGSTRRHAIATAREAMQVGKLHVSPAYETTSGGQPRLDIDIAAPVYAQDPHSSRIVGALVFQLDPRINFDLFLQRWPAPNESGESFLFERAGEEIVYLSTLRHADAAQLRRRVGDPSLPAALAVRGKQGVVEGLDYRGVPVLAAVGQVPDMPWFVVSKLDREEILAPVRREALWSGTLASLLVMALGLAMLAWHRRGQSELALTQQESTKAALAASEARFRRLIENAWDLLVLFDRDMRIVYASPSVEQQLGGSLTGEGIASGTALVHPEDVGRVEVARVNALAHPGLPQRFEHRVRGRYDHWMLVEANFTNHFDDPDIVALTYIGRDVSERKWAERALRDSEERYRFLFKLSPDAVFVHWNNVVLYTNDAAVRLFRAESERDLVGRNWHDLVAPEDWPKTEQRTARLVGGGEAYLQPAEMHYRALDGQVIEVEAAGARIVVDGKPAIMSVVRDISERKRAEAALRESEARLQAIIEHAPHGIAIVSTKGRYTMVNPAQCRILGYSETELIGKSFRDFTHSDDADLNEEMALEMIQGRTDHFTLEKRYLRKDGQTIWVVLSVSAVHDESGALRYFIGLLQDITERKRMEQALREGEARYRFLFESSPLPMWVFDTETLAFLEVNGTAVAQYGYSREEFLAMTLRDIRPPEEVAELEQVVKADVRKQGRIWTHRRKDGSLIKAAIWFQDVDFLDRPARMILAENVTARVEAEQALSESEARLRAIFDSAPVGIAIADAAGRYLMVNRAQCEMLGYGEAELLQKTYADITHPDDVQANLDLGASLLDGEISVGSIEKRYVRKDGTSFWVLLTIGLVRTAEGEVVGSVGVAQDITERREAEARRLEYARQQRDTLVREVHHRIKNHLQGLAGLLRQHMHEQPGLAPVLQKFAAQVNAISIVHGLQGRAEKGDASLRSLAAEIVAFLGAITGTQIGLACPGPACLWAVAEAEAVPLALILNELLTNALRHGTDKTRVSLSIECDEGRAQLVIRNPGRLDGLDFAGGKGLGTGLSLIRSLLPPEGVAFRLENAEDGWVETRLELGPPVLQPIPQVQVVSLR